MEYNDGSYGQDTYGRDNSDGQDGTGRGTGGYNNPRANNPYGQSSSYGRDYYDQASSDGSYGQSGYGGNTGRTPRPRDDGYGYSGNTGRTPRPQDDGYGYSGNTGRTPRPQDDGYGYSGNTGRTPRPQEDDYGYSGNTGRTPRPQDDGYGYGSRRAVNYEDTDRTQMDPRAVYGGDDGDEEAYQAPRRTPRKKKKRSKAAKFFRGLGAYISQLPAKTLVIFGGSVAVVLVAIILLVILLPKQQDTTPADNGQLSIADITPTPSLPPADTPEPVMEAMTPEPTAAVSLNGVVIKTIGEENDIIPTVQERLVTLGYMTMPEGGYTKKYGPTTKTAVRLFQIKNYDDSKQWDGQLGDGTLSLMMSETAKAYYLARGDGDDRTKDITKLVEDVKKIQDRLIALGYLAAGANTGVYGDSTSKAVLTFQQYNGLGADGKAGPATLSLIYTDAALDAVTGKANYDAGITPAPAVTDGTTAADGATVTPDPAAPAAGTTNPAEPAIDDQTVAVN